MHKSFSFALSVCIGVVLFSYTLNAQTFGVGSQIEAFKLSDTEGKSHSYESLKGKKGTVIVFLSAQCPVVHAYNERLNAIYTDYSSRGFSFIGINSNVTESNEMVMEHTKLNYRFPVLIDSKNILADKFGANYTPEIFLFSKKGVLIYHGAIDNDRFAKNITSQHLRTALDETFLGKAITKSETRAFGCTIKRVEK